jgi:hypothetical protein
VPVFPEQARAQIGHAMKAFPLFFFSHRAVISLLPAGVVLCAANSRAQSTPPQFNAGVAWGQVQISALKEASGLATGWREGMLLWTHNDGDRRQLYALTPGGQHAATFLLPEAVSDLEEIAAGPGPVPGVAYLYAGDIGGKDGPGDVRTSVKILRMAEPEVAPPAGGPVPQMTLSGVDVFTLRYPDGSYDAEAMLADPLTGDFYLITKTEPVARVYYTNLNAVPSRAAVTLSAAGTLPLANPSAAAISRDGRLILVRNEDSALLWLREPGESVAEALTRSAAAAPVIGTPLEPNGEAVTFAGGGSSYITLSEGTGPMLYYFQARIPEAPAMRAPLQGQTVYEGGTLRIQAAVSGYPVPTFVWRRNGATVPGQTGSVLTLSGVTATHAGLYELTATNSQGSATAAATVTVKPRPDLRITEVQTDPAAATGSDWWELTSFEPEPVDLSGWRFNDDSGDLSNAFPLPAGLVIEPGESIVLVDDLTESQFRAWWGAAVPAGARIITYDGSGLALGPGGDTLRVWDSATTSTADTLLRVTTGQATRGVTFTYQPDAAWFGALSVEGVNGALRSAAGTDTGSPGAWLPPPVAPEPEVSVSAGRMRLTFLAVRHHWYTLEASADMQTEMWTRQGLALQAAADGPLELEAPVAAGQRFYRVKVR